MKNIILCGISVLSFFLSSKTFAQTKQKLPVQIGYNVVASTINISNGSTRNLEALEVLYTDGSIERANIRELKKNSRCK